MESDNIFSGLKVVDLSSFNFLRAGCGVLTMNTSAHATSCWTTCWAPGDFRSSVMLRLLRLARCH